MSCTRTRAGAQVGMMSRFFVPGDPRRERWRLSKRALTSPADHVVRRRIDRRCGRRADWLGRDT